MRIQRFLGSVIGASLLFALPISPRVSSDGGVSFGIERAQATELDVNRPVHRKARRHVEPVFVAEGAVEDPRYIAYCTGNNSGGWNGGTYRGGIFMDLNCHGYVAGEPGYRGWGIPGPFIWW